MTFEGGPPDRPNRVPHNRTPPIERRPEPTPPDVHEEHPQPHTPDRQDHRETPQPQPRPQERRNHDEAPRRRPEVPNTHRPARRVHTPSQIHQNHDDHHGKTSGSFLGNALGIGVASALAVAGGFVRGAFDISKFLYIEGEKKISHFWSVLVKSLKHPMGGASSASHAPVADHGHDDHGAGHAEAKH